MATKVTVVLPFTWKLSKNYKLGRARNGRVYLPKEVREAMDDLKARVREATAEQEWFDAKVWIRIFAEMPNRNGDAINFIESVADAVKVAIGIDDNWFSVELDWTLSRDDPKLHVVIEQEAEEHFRFCTHCGKEKPLTEFTRLARNVRYRGYDYICRGCNTTRSKMYYAKRKENRVGKGV